MCRYVESIHDYFFYYSFRIWHFVLMEFFIIVTIFNDLVNLKTIKYLLYLCIHSCTCYII